MISCHKTEREFSIFPDNEIGNICRFLKPTLEKIIFLVRKKSLPQKKHLKINIEKILVNLEEFAQKIDYVNNIYSIMNLEIKILEEKLLKYLNTIIKSSTFKASDINNTIISTFKKQLCNCISTEIRVLENKISCHHSSAMAAHQISRFKYILLKNIFNKIKILESKLLSYVSFKKIAAQQIIKYKINFFKSNFCPKISLEIKKFKSILLNHSSFKITNFESQEFKNKMMNYIYIFLIEFLSKNLKIDEKIVECLCKNIKDILKYNITSDNLINFILDPKKITENHITIQSITNNTELYTRMNNFFKL